MPIFTIVFIVFIFLLTHALRKNNSDQKQVEENFWKREQEANEVRKQDISNLQYITIPVEKLPPKDGSELWENLKKLSHEQILNLTGLTNTDLKLQYGPANLNTLLACDEHFTELVQLLDAYSGELLDADRREDARTVLEYAVSIGCDASGIYTKLGSLYAETADFDGIKRLIATVEDSSLYSRRAVADQLTSYLPKVQ